MALDSLQGRVQAIVTPALPMAASHSALASVKLNEDIVILIGAVGSGKATFIKHIPGVKAVKPVKQKTRKTEITTYSLPDLTIVDTPDLDGIEGHDDQLIKDIKSYSENQKVPPTFIYCHSIREARYTASARDCFDSFRKLCGSSLKAGIVTTHWDPQGTEYHGKQETLYKEFSEKIWKEWVQLGRGLYRTDNTASESILVSLLKKDPRVGLDDPVIVLLGPSGSGKTTFIKRFTQKAELPEQDPTMPIHVIYDDANRLTFLDTRALDGDLVQDSRIIGQIKVACSEQKQWPAFVYCHSVRDPRFVRSARDSFKMASRVFNVPVNVAVVTTHWDGEDGGYFRRHREIHKKLGSDVWGGWKKRGLLFHKTNNTPEAAEEIVHAVLKNEVKVRKLRMEVETTRTTDRVSREDAVRTVRRRLEDSMRGKGREERSEIEAELRILKYYDGPPEDSWWRSLLHI